MDSFQLFKSTHHLTNKKPHQCGVLILNRKKLFLELVTTIHDQLS